MTDHPVNDQRADTRNASQVAIAAFVVLMGFIGLISCAESALTDSSPNNEPVNSYAPDQTALLHGATKLSITDVREETGLLGAHQTVITILYKAGPDGHHPSRQQNTITPSRGETVYADSSMSIGTTKGLDEPIAPHIERELRIGFDISIHDLQQAQLNLDTAIFAGDFTRRINNG